MNSQADGSRPPRRDARRPPGGRLLGGKDAQSSRRCVGCGTRRSVARVTTPSVPSLPTKRAAGRSPPRPCGSCRRDRAAGRPARRRAGPRRTAPSSPYLAARGTAGVLGDVAADRARPARGRIGRIEEADLLDVLLERLRDDARLDDRVQVLAVDLEDAVHAPSGRGRRRRRRRAPRPRGPSARPAASPETAARAPPRAGARTSSSVRGVTTTSGPRTRSSVSSCAWASSEARRRTRSSPQAAPGRGPRRAPRASRKERSTGDPSIGAARRHDRLH